MSLIPFLFIIFCLTLLGAVNNSKPVGWVVVGLSVLALLLQLLGPHSVR